jgi:hypothetical protein
VQARAAQPDYFLEISLAVEASGSWHLLVAINPTHHPRSLFAQARGRREAARGENGSCGNEPCSAPPRGDFSRSGALKHSRLRSRDRAG